MNKKLKLFIKRKNILLFLIIAVVLLAKGCAVTLPSIKGTVYYADGKTPVNDAYILSFTCKYLLTEAINVGGANSDINDVEIVKTDSDGKFRLSPYWTISLNVDDTREFLIYKPGYSVLRYFQSGIFSFSDMNDFPWKKKIKPKKIFIIPKNFNNYNNNLIYVAGNISRYAEHFKYNDKEKYNKNLGIFREIYWHLMNDYDNYVNSDEIHENARKNWPRTMKNLQYYLDIDK